PWEPRGRDPCDAEGRRARAPPEAPCTPTDPRGGGERPCLQSETAGSFRNQPFLGKSFYLDLPNNKNTQFLLETIKHLGGVSMIESFLSKEVSYVVSSSKEAKLDSRLGRQTKKQSCTASWDDKAKILPSVTSKGGCHARPSPKPADSVNTVSIQGLKQRWF
uniref:BRCT domain-containing protein n=1 Tax=Crocodylus porosus TaxID=8502 RepID=A0A7M4EJD5_CROPO